jgi:exonuclease III
MAWNINSLQKKNMRTFLEEHDPDILCLSETNLTRLDIQLWEDLRAVGYRLYMNPGTIRSD